MRLPLRLQLRLPLPLTIRLLRRFGPGEADGSTRRALQLAVDRAGVSHEVFAGAGPSRKELLRVLVGLEPVAGAAGDHEVSRLRPAAAGDRLNVIQSRLREGHHPAAVHAVVITVAVGGGLERPPDGGGEAVAALEPLASRGAPKGATQVMVVVVVPEGGHAASHRQSKKRSPERIIQSPRWPMTSQVHVRLSNRIVPEPRVAQGLPCTARVTCMALRRDVPIKGSADQGVRVLEAIKGSESSDTHGVVPGDDGRRCPQAGSHPGHSPSVLRRA